MRDSLLWAAGFILTACPLMSMWSTLWIVSPRGKEAEAFIC